MTAPSAADIAVAAEKERLCQAGIGVVELYADGMATQDMPLLSLGDAAEQIEAVILYALMLERIIHSKSGLTVPELREAARGNAAAWRTRIPAPHREDPR